MKELHKRNRNPKYKKKFEVVNFYEIDPYLKIQITYNLHSTPVPQTTIAIGILI